MSDPLRLPFASIAPLVAHTAWHGRALRCRFRCPVTGREVESSWDPGPAPTDWVRQGAALADSHASWTIREVIFHLVRKWIGNKALARLAADAAHAGLRAVAAAPAPVAPQPSREETEAAVLRAFQAVADRFVWDGRRRAWVAAEALRPDPTAWQTRVEAAPVTDPFDRGVFLRLLAAIAAADGTVDAKERDLLATWAGADRVESLLEEGEPSPIELQAVPEGALRETMILAAWAIALSSEGAHEAEEAVVARAAQAFSWQAGRSHQLKKLAQDHLLRQALDVAFADERLCRADRDTLMGVGSAVGLEPTETERVLVEFRKRHGLE